MRLLVFICSLTFLYSVYLEEEEVVKNIVEQTPNTFPLAVSNSKMVLNLYYAPWCGHCKQFMPVFDKFCGEVSAKSSDIICSRINCDEHKDFCGEHKIQGYPTLKRYVGKKSCVYNGERNMESLHDLIQRTDMVLKDINNKYELSSYIGKSGETIFIGYFKESLPEAEDLLLSATCESTPFKIAIVKKKEIASLLNIPDTEGIYLIKNGTMHSKYDGKYDDNTEFGKFQFISSSELLPLYSVKSASSIFSSHFSKYASILYDAKEASSDEILKNVEALAKKFTGKVRFFATENSDPDSQHVVEYFRVKKFPSLCLYDDENNKFYHYQEESFDIENMAVFIQDCLDGKVDPFRAKQPVPEGWDATPVKTLVVDNFELAKASGKNMFVMFYAPWCGHCKSLKPIWEQLGEQFKDDPNTLIAQMDATENDMPSLNIHSFPTLKVFKKDGEIVDYSGDRSLDGLREFIESDFAIRQETPEEENREVDTHDEL